MWPPTIVQTCIIHLIRNTFRLTSRQYWDELKRDIKPIYTAVNAAAARAAFDDLAEKWGGRYPAVIRLWDNAWEEFIPFLDYDIEIRRVICSTNAIESLNARFELRQQQRLAGPVQPAADVHEAGMGLAQGCEVGVVVGFVRPGEYLRDLGVVLPEGLERNLGVRNPAAGGGAHRVGDLSGGQPVAGDLRGRVQVGVGFGEGQCGERPGVVDGDELHDQAFVPRHVEGAVLEEPCRAGEVFYV